MLFLRLFFRGLRDFFEQFMLLALCTILWWAVVLVCVAIGYGIAALLATILGFSAVWWLVVVITVMPLVAIGIGPATVTLFAMADPRRQLWSSEIGDAMGIFTSSVRRGWGQAMTTFPFIAILMWNIYYFFGTGETLGAFVPLWFIMLVLLFVLTFYVFSVAGTMESGVRNAWRGAMFVLVSRPFVSLFLSVMLFMLTFAMAVTVIPMLLIGPALLASITNRFALTILGEEIVDPMAPTVERADERERGVNPDPSLWSRIRPGKRRTQA